MHMFFNMNVCVSYIHINACIYLLYTHNLYVSMFNLPMSICIINFPRIATILQGSFYTVVGVWVGVGVRHLKLVGLTRSIQNITVKDVKGMESSNCRKSI